MILETAQDTLTSLNFDWILSKHPKASLGRRGWLGRDENSNLMSLYRKLFSLRFPHLKAFQFRNAIVWETGIPFGLYLLDICTLTYEEQLELVDGKWTLVAS